MGEQVTESKRSNVRNVNETKTKGERAYPRVSQSLAEIFEILVEIQSLGLETFTQLNTNKIKTKHKVKRIKI